MIFLGIGEMIGPLFYGIITDKYGNRVSLMVLAVFMTAGIADLIYYNELNEFN